MVWEVKSGFSKYLGSVLEIFSPSIRYVPFIQPFIHNTVSSCFLYVLVCENTGVLVKILSFFGCFLRQSFCNLIALNVGMTRSPEHADCPPITF